MKSGSLAPTLCVGVSISALCAAMGWDAERPKRERERLGKKLTAETQFSIWVHLITHMSHFLNHIDNAYVCHRRRSNLRSFFHQVFNWGMCRVDLYKIDAAMLEALHVMPAFTTLATGMLFIAAIFWGWAKWICLIDVFLGAGVILISMVGALHRYRSLGPSFYLPLVIPVQIFGYGLGFLYNFWRRVVCGKNEN